MKPKRLVTVYRSAPPGLPPKEWHVIESTDDFKSRLAAILRAPGEPILGAQHANQSLVRGSKDRGYHPTDARV